MQFATCKIEVFYCSTPHPRKNNKYIYESSFPHFKKTLQLNFFFSFPDRQMIVASAAMSTSTTSSPPPSLVLLLLRPRPFLLLLASAASLALLSRDLPGAEVAALFGGDGETAFRRPRIAAGGPTSASWSGGGSGRSLNAIYKEAGGDVKEAEEEEEEENILKGSDAFNFSSEVDRELLFFNRVPKTGSENFVKILQVKSKLHSISKFNSFPSIVFPY